MDEQTFNERALAESAITAYRVSWYGVEYRSHLEKKWSAFFLRMGIKRKYEPLDAKYGDEPGPFKGWLPDFRLDNVMADGRPVYVEVKPYSGFDIPKQTLRRLMESSAPPPYAIVGATPWAIGWEYAVDNRGKRFVVRTSGIVKLRKGDKWWPFGLVNVSGHRTKPVIRLVGIGHGQILPETDSPELLDAGGIYHQSWFDMAKAWYGKSCTEDIARDPDTGKGVSPWAYSGIRLKLTRFVQSHYVNTGPLKRAEPAPLYHRYQLWCLDHGFDPLPLLDFLAVLEEMGFKQYKQYVTEIELS